MTKLVCFSDTHTLHEQIILPEGDIAIFAGDCCGRGTFMEANLFIHWYAKQSHKHKIMIAGNHDWAFEGVDASVLEQSCKDNGIIYLNDSDIEIDGIKFWGSPVQPEFFNWAFNRKRGEDIKKHWDLIPQDTKILITHGPAHGILDLVETRGSINNGQHVGCEELLKAIQYRPSITHHIFGHIHEGYGQMEQNGVQYINASTCDKRYRPINPVIEVEL